VQCESSDKKLNYIATYLSITTLGGGLLGGISHVFYISTCCSSVILIRATHALGLNLCVLKCGHHTNATKLHKYTGFNES
jgi:hypothetical protein